MNAQEQPAVAGPVESTVEPFAWMSHESARRLQRGGNSKGSVPVHGTASAVSVLPLYSQAALDAAVAAERERRRAGADDAAPLEQVMPKCGGCRYWEEFDEEDGAPIGTCKRYPPQRAVETAEAAANHGGEPKLIFNARDWCQPSTAIDNWCGEFWRL